MMNDASTILSGCPDYPTPKKTSRQRTSTVQVLPTDPSPVMDDVRTGPSRKRLKRLEVC